MISTPFLFRGSVDLSKSLNSSGFSSVYTTFSGAGVSRWLFTFCFCSSLVLKSRKSAYSPASSSSISSFSFNFCFEAWSSFGTNTDFSKSIWSVCSASSFASACSFGSACSICCCSRCDAAPALFLRYTAFEGWIMKCSLLKYLETLDVRIFFLKLLRLQCWQTMLFPYKLQ